MRRYIKTKHWFPLLTALTLIAGIWIGWALNGSHSLPKAQQKLFDLLSTIEDEYVDEIDMDSLVEMSIPHILQNLDPHSAYIPAADLTAVNSELDGSFSGIGISFQIMNDTICVVEVISGGPAEKVGILAGDRIVKVDGKTVAGTGITNKEVFSLLRGDEGTHVNVGVRRSNTSKLLTYDVTRGDIPVTSIDAAYMISEDVGYIKVNKFGKATYEEFLQSLNRLRVDGATSYIVDLRGNGGGYMEPAILMVNEFLGPSHVIVETKGRRISDNAAVLSDGSGSFRYAGIIILIDEFTASASEIFSGAIQDNDRGLIVGRRSFGKGLVQRPILMEDSSEVRLTVQRYHTPSGRCIQKEYTPGANLDYESEIINRYNNGEVMSADSVKLNTDEKYLTIGGRTVYGGGGIMPDIFVPNDTSGVTSYYINVANAGLIQKFAYEYCDLNRDDLQNCGSVGQLTKKLPSDDVLLSSFVHYASINGIPARWYYIGISKSLIVNQVKAWIARDILGISAYFEIINSTDNTIKEALKHIDDEIPVASGIPYEGQQK